MADIIVRIPTGQLSHFLNDKMTTDLAFWRLSKKPRNLKAGDYIFFTRPQGVAFAAPVRRIVEGEELTDEINIFHMMGDAGNFNACWNGTTDTSRFDPPISTVNYAGRGFRYATPEEKKTLRRMLTKK